MQLVLCLVLCLHLVQVGRSQDPTYDSTLERLNTLFNALDPKINVSVTEILSYLAPIQQNTDYNIQMGEYYIEAQRQLFVSKLETIELQWGDYKNLTYCTQNRTQVEELVEEHVNGVSMCATNASSQASSDIQTAAQSVKITRLMVTQLYVQLEGCKGFTDEQKELFCLMVVTSEVEDLEYLPGKVDQLIGDAQGSLANLIRDLQNCYVTRVKQLSDEADEIIAQMTLCVSS